MSKRIQGEIAIAMKSNDYDAAYFDRTETEFKPNLLYIKFQIPPKHPYFPDQIHVISFDFEYHEKDKKHSYPAEPPNVEFLTPVWHPNVSGTTICLDILKNEWSPFTRVDTIIQSLILLMEFPNFSSALNNKAHKDKFDPETCKKYYEDMMAKNKTYYDNLFALFEKK